MGSYLTSHHHTGEDKVDRIASSANEVITLTAEDRKDGDGNDNDEALVETSKECVYRVKCWSYNMNDAKLSPSSNLTLG